MELNLNAKIIKTTKCQNVKNHENQKMKKQKLKICQKMFLTKFWSKIIFWRRNLSFQGLPAHQNIKIWAVSNMPMSQRPKKPKRNDLFRHFSVPGRTIRGHPWIDLDLSCSELFFRVPCDSYSVLNDLICFGHFARFYRFHHFCNFCHFSFFSPFFIFWKLFYPPTHLFYSGRLKIA